MEESHLHVLIKDFIKLQYFLLICYVNIKLEIEK